MYQWADFKQTKGRDRKLRTRYRKWVWSQNFADFRNPLPDCLATPLMYMYTCVLQWVRAAAGVQVDGAMDCQTEVSPCRVTSRILGQIGNTKYLGAVFAWSPLITHGLFPKIGNYGPFQIWELFAGTLVTKPTLVLSKYKIPSVKYTCSIFFWTSKILVSLVNYF